MRPPFERSAINRMLASHGLGTLDDRGCITQLAFLVQDHDHFRSLLTRCEPEHRRDMYEAMRANLHFEAKPLDVYLAESGAIAEAKQLPLVSPDGTLKPFCPPEVSAAQAAVNAAFAKHKLVLTCNKCTKVEEFLGDRRIDAVMNARLAGWTYNELNGTGRETCPDCPVGLIPFEWDDMEPKPGKLKTTGMILPPI